MDLSEWLILAWILKEIHKDDETKLLLIRKDKFRQENCQVPAKSTILSWDGDTQTMLGPIDLWDKIILPNSDIWYSDIGEEADGATEGRH